MHFAFLWSAAGHVERSSRHQISNVLVELLHSEPRQVRPKRDLRVALPFVRSDGRLSFNFHVVIPALVILLPPRLISTLDLEPLGEDVGELGTVTVPTARGLLLVIVVIIAGEQVAKYHFRHVHVMLLVHLYRQALPIVFHADHAFLFVDVNLDVVLVLRVSLEIVRRIHQNLVEYFVQPWDVIHVHLLHLLLLLDVDPDPLPLHL
mmetsp:Transcript_110399/g.308694  ORF Transcript_110399/g.308694 Transcript_110399/m.308694 type:complete len:206 (-) Transcript_110399:204-821(-)